MKNCIIVSKNFYQILRIFLYVEFVKETESLEGDILSTNNQKPHDIIGILEESGFTIKIFNEYWYKKNS